MITTGDFTAQFTRKSDMLKARTWLGKRCILAKADAHHGDNRLHVLVPPKVDGAGLVRNMTDAGFTFAIWSKDRP